MKTVQMTLDDDLVTVVDAIAQNEGTTRSAFTRDALRSAVEAYHTSQRERQQIQGYQQAPPKPGEFDDYEQAWIE